MYISINKVIDELKTKYNLTDDSTVTIYFDKCYRNSKYTNMWNVIPLGIDVFTTELKRFVFTDEFPGIKYISIKESKSRRFFEVKSFSCIIANAKELEYKGFKYHDSIVKQVDNKTLEIFFKNDPLAE